MNIKKKSIIIPAFALLIGASLAGSITGTVAWYQYSTRVNTAYVGVSGGTSGNLQIRLADQEEWSTRLTKDDISAYIGSATRNTDKYGTEIVPITSGNMEKDKAIPNFYLNPIYGQGGGYANWQKADKANYIVLPLQLRYVERDGVKENNVDEKESAKKVYLSDLTIQQDKKLNEAENPQKKDLSAAIRFHIDAYMETEKADDDAHTNRLISKKGGTTMTVGQLDLDGDGELDYKYQSGDMYGFDDADTKVPLNYGNGSQISFSNEIAKRPGTYFTPDGEDGADTEVFGMVVGNVGDSLDIDDDTKEYDTGKSKSIGSTASSSADVLNVKVTIWVEGWQTFKNANDENVSMWDSLDYINSHFDVGFQFAVDPVEE